MTWPYLDFSAHFVQRHMGAPADAASFHTASATSPPSPRALDAPRDAHVAEPVRYQPLRHGSLAYFRASPDFPVFRAELMRHLTSLGRLAYQHLSTATSVALTRDMAQLHDRAMGFDAAGRHIAWGASADQFFNHGQNLLALFSRRITDDSIDLQVRLNTLQEVIPRLTLCLEGTLLALTQGCIELDRTRTGFAATADRAFDALIEQSIVASVQHLHAESLRLAPATQVHWVAGLQAALYPAMGRPPPPVDRLAIAPTAKDFSHAHKQLRLVLVPGQLCGFLAETCLQRWHDAFAQALNRRLPPSEGWPWTDDLEAAARQADAALMPEFGTVPRHCVLALDEGEDGELLARPLQEPSMLGRHFLNECRRLGVITTDREPQPVSVQRVPHPLMPDRTTTLTVMHQDSVLTWTEEAGLPRPLRITDLSLWADEIWAHGLPRTASRAAVHAALRCADPSELQRIASLRILQDESHCHRFASRLSDDTLQSMLCASDVHASQRRSRWFLNALVAQQRVALLATDRVTAWTTLTPAHVTGDLVHLALAHDSAPLMTAVAALLRSSFERHPHTEDFQSWQVNCLMPPLKPGQPNPLALAIAADRRATLRAYVLMLAELRVGGRQPGDPSAGWILGMPAGSNSYVVMLLRIHLHKALAQPSPQSLTGLVEGMLSAWKRGTLSKTEISDAFELAADAVSSPGLLDLAAQRHLAHFGVLQAAVACLWPPHRADAQDDADARERVRDRALRGAGRTDIGASPTASDPAGPPPDTPSGPSPDVSGSPSRRL